MKEKLDLPQLSPEILSKNGKSSRNLSEKIDKLSETCHEKYRHKSDKPADSDDEQLQQHPHQEGC